MLSPLYTKIIIAGFLATGIIGSVVYIKLLRAELVIASQAIAKLEGVVDAQKLVMDKQAEDIEKIREISQDLGEQFATANREKVDLQKRLNEQTKKIGSLALTQPKQVQELINLGTKYALRCNEIVTGAPLQLNDEKNNICPELIKSRKQ
jgi:alkylhydroperoxidase/carboxymuconolactone decarboxylase family protein YurZ